MGRLELPAHGDEWLGPSFGDSPRAEALRILWREPPFAPRAPDDGSTLAEARLETLRALMPAPVGG